MPRADRVRGARTRGVVPLVVALVAAAHASSAGAQLPFPRAEGLAGARPPLTPHPSEADWRFLRDPAQRTDAFDALKYLPFADDGASFLTVGFDSRVEVERYGHTAFGAARDSPRGYVLPRLMLDADLHLTPHVRAFVMGASATAVGRVGGPRPGIDEDRLDLHEGFVDLSTGLFDARQLTLRAGRQEITYDSGLLFADQEGLNVRSSFDAARVIAVDGRRRLEAFVAYPVSLTPGTLDDTPDRTRAVWGLHGDGVAALGPLALASYYFGSRNDRVRYQAGTASERRHTVGLRVANHVDNTPWALGWGADWEANLQRGTFGARPIHAWSFDTETGYRWAWAASPRLALRVDGSSGDRGDPRGALGSFNPLFPKSAYFAPKAVLGTPINFYDLHPILQADLSRRMNAQVDWAWFWRQQLTDGFYAPGNVLVRPGTPAQARFIAQQANAAVQYTVDAHLQLAFNTAYVLPGAFLRETGPAKHVTFFNLGLSYKI